MSQKCIIINRFLIDFSKLKEVSVLFNFYSTLYISEFFFRVRSICIRFVIEW